MNPYGLLGGALAWGLSLLATAWFAFGLGKDHELATQAREDAAEERATDKALRTAADILANIEVTNGPVREKLVHEVRTDVRYTDCSVGPVGLSGLNEAITGIAAQPAGGGGLPAASAASGPEHGRAPGEGR